MIDGGDRAAGFSIPGEIIGEGGVISFELACVEGESWGGPNIDPQFPGCHTTVEWVQILDNGVEIFNACVSAGSVNTVGRCDDPSQCGPTTSPPTTSPPTTSTPDNCTVENCGGSPCSDPITDKCCGDDAGNCGCCPNITWTCCPGLVHCAASLGDCP